MPSCLGISTGSIKGAAQAIEYTIRVPQSFATAIGSAQLEINVVDPPMHFQGKYLHGLQTIRVSP
eukprot:926350-Pyramimonas_sp.AAC.2